MAGNGQYTGANSSYELEMQYNSYFDEGSVYSPSEDDAAPVPSATKVCRAFLISICKHFSGLGFDVPTKPWAKFATAAKTHYPCLAGTVAECRAVVPLSALCQLYPHRLLPRGNVFIFFTSA